MKLYGNLEALKRLYAYSSQERLPHALLFFGDSGTGKRTLADYTALLYFCEKSRTEPCMSCNSCKRITEHIHPDVIYKSCDDISAKDMRELLKSTFELPVEGKLRVCIFTEFQLLNRECQNALLTFLEEPSDKLRFILTASNKNGILPTILSRTVSIKTEPLSVSQCEQVLTDMGFSDAGALALFANGNPGLALKIASDKNLANYIEFSKELTEHIYKNREYDALTLIQRLPQPKDDKREPVRILICEAEKIFHDAFVYSQGGSPSLGCCSSLSKEISQKLTPEVINRLCEKMNGFSKSVNETNFNPKIAYSAFIAEIFSVLTI